VGIPSVGWRPHSLTKVCGTLEGGLAKGVRDFICEQLWITETELFLVALRFVGLGDQEADA